RLGEDQCIIHDADRVPAWVAPGIAEGAQLLEAHAREPGLFPELAPRGDFQRLVLLDQAARRPPPALQGRIFAGDMGARAGGSTARSRARSANTTVSTVREGRG